MFIASVGGAGICLLLVGTRRMSDGRIRAAPNGQAAARKRMRAGVTATAAGVAAFIVTGWPVAAPFTVLAVLGLRGLGGRTAGHVIEKLEAIACWTEMLRDNLAGAAGLTQALIATAQISPRQVRSEVGSLAIRLSNGMAVIVALRIFAEELADPAADVVVATLLLAASERAQRLGDLLGALAASTREEVTMREGVEASRSAARSAVRTVTGFSFGFLGLMAVFARPYLAPYRSFDGQVALAVVGILFGVGLWLMAVMVRPGPSPRLFVPETSG
jgi:hypothetical protein